MPQRTMDDILDVIEPIQDGIRRAMKAKPDKAIRELIEADHALQALITELAAGARDRAKRRRQRAKARQLSTGADVPLWGGDTDGE